MREDASAGEDEGFSPGEPANGVVIEGAADSADQVAIFWPTDGVFSFQVKFSRIMLFCSYLNIACNVGVPNVAQNSCVDFMNGV